MERQLDAAAGVRQPPTSYAVKHLEGRFTAIEQCMAVTKAQAPDVVTRYVEDFLARMKREGLIRKALMESGQDETQAAD